MVSKLSIVVGIAATLQSAVAQEPIKGPLDNYPADNIATLAPFPGYQDDHCAPAGPNIRWNATYFPCRYTMEMDRDCAKPVDANAPLADKQAKWEEQRKCLCVEHPDYFDAAGRGCVGCKKAYQLETEGNYNQYIGRFKALKGEAYCEAKVLTGDYAKHYADLDSQYPATYENMPTPLPPKSIPVEAYWDRDNKNKEFARPDAKAKASTTETGVANLPPVIMNRFGYVESSPATNSSKFTKTKQTAVGAAIIVNRQIIANAEGWKVVNEPQQPIVYRFNDDFPITEFRSPEILVDFSPCSCAKSVVPAGSQPVINEKSIQVFTEFVKTVGFTVSEQPQQQCQGCTVYVELKTHSDSALSSGSTTPVTVENKAQLTVEGNAQVKDISC
ncbi:hypothetical protein HRG_004596 [Hirsutella rhossiliensis]|uniref:Uncharacterized protein n=1 Tax=Hirsutella rhossiliensis TaxID=111463 RepID=A0A9P8MY21_9HYPO|nr:uncharacterized protein HRG_04596 [Hirsutella rhossiliensis]KAH0964168.1 hypothetical protein HRG_04596 [Hirsutella rhossiliensis]